MWPSVCPGVNTSRTLPSPNTSTPRPKRRERVDVRRRRSRSCGSRTRGRTGAARSRAVAGRDTVDASSHSCCETRNVAPGNSEIPLAWSPCRWVMRTVLISAGSMPRDLQLGGHRVRGLHLRREHARAHPAEVLLRVDGDRGVEARVDQDPPGARVLDEEGDVGHLARVAAHARERAQPGEAALLAVEPRVRSACRWPRAGGGGGRWRRRGRPEGAARQAGARRACGCSLPARHAVPHLRPRSARRPGRSWSPAAAAAWAGPRRSS